MAKAAKTTKSAKSVKKTVKGTHVVLRGSERGKDPKAVEIGKIDPSEQIVVTIGLAGPKLPTADQAARQAAVIQYDASLADRQIPDRIPDEAVSHIEGRVTPLQAVVICVRRRGPAGQVVHVVGEVMAPGVTGAV